MDQQDFKIVKPRTVPIRNLWKKEDKDFTKWMEENIDYLNEKLDFDITIESSFRYIKRTSTKYGFTKFKIHYIMLHIGSQIYIKMIIKVNKIY